MSEDPFQVGKYFDVLPIPPAPEHCISVQAGPVTFVVEARQLTDGDIVDNFPQFADEFRDRGTAGLDDYGASLHVFGDSDGLEHLRFDCFDHNPHYHYIRHSDGGNRICTLDTSAEGEPIDWALERLRTRLPEMLMFAGQSALAAETAARISEVSHAIEEVAALLRRAQDETMSAREMREVTAAR